MDAAYVPALAALAGSAIGALASFATTWLTQHAQTRIQLLDQDRQRRETLYSEFIAEASRLFTDALTHEMDNLGKLVRLHSTVNKMRLFSSPEIVEQAQEVLQVIISAHYAPNKELREIRDSARDHELDPLRAFSEACRAELRASWMRI